MWSVRTYFIRWVLSQALRAVAVVGAFSFACSVAAESGFPEPRASHPAEAYHLPLPLPTGATIQTALDASNTVVLSAGSYAGGAVKIIDARLPTSVILARTGDRDYAAASLLCPHRGVEVEYRPEQREFRCASLGHSKFCEDGSLKKGLARKGLTHHGAKLDPADANSLVVTF